MLHSCTHMATVDVNCQGLRGSHNRDELDINGLLDYTLLLEMGVISIISDRGRGIGRHSLKNNISVPIPLLPSCLICQAPCLITITQQREPAYNWKNHGIFVRDEHERYIRAAEDYHKHNHLPAAHRHTIRFTNRQTYVHINTVVLCEYSKFRIE